MTLDQITEMQPDVVKLNEQAISFIESGTELNLDNILDSSNEPEVHLEFYKNVALLQKR